MNLHALDIEGCIERITTEDRHAFDAVKRARPRIVRLVEAIEPGFSRGGRLIYVGAGTSGRLGVLDASETPPTFQIPPDRIIGIIAGGDAALRISSEGKEDDASGSHAALKELKLTQDDCVIAIAAGGTTPYALGAVTFAKEAGTGVTALLCCAQVQPPQGCDHLIMLRTGPEVITGSTRMKAGTATKLTLNAISTTLMIRTGRVYQNLMVDLKASNDKLRDRAARIITMITGLSRDEAFSLLAQASGEVKTAVVMNLLGVAANAARELIASSNGRLGEVLPEVSQTYVANSDANAEDDE